MFPTLWHRSIVAYFEGGTVNGYTAESAPIMFMTNCGGFMGAMASSIGGGMSGTMGGMGELPEGGFGRRQRYRLRSLETGLCGCQRRQPRQTYDQ